MMSIGGSASAKNAWCMGIDIGAHACSAAITKDGVVVDIPLEEPQQEDSAAHFQLPACVSVADSGFLVGSDARKRARSGDQSTVFDLVRLCGASMQDLSDADRSKWPFRVVPGESDKAMVEITSTTPPINGAGAASTTRAFHPEELVAVLIRSIKEKAESLVSANVDSTVICAPEGFNHTQRRAIRDACVIAGLHVEKLLGSATASAISFRVRESQADGAIASIIDPPPAFSQVVLVVDCGASSTDIALVSVVNSKFEVKAVASELQIGGDAFTERIAAHCHRRNVPSAHASEAPGSAAGGVNQIRHACELAKKLLSSSANAIVGIDFPACDAFGYYTVTRACFEALCEDLWQSLLERARRVIHEGSVAKEHITTVLLRGGSFQIPRLRALFTESFASQQVVLWPPRVSPARGAAAFASQEAASSVRSSTPAQDGDAPAAIELLEVTPLSLGIQSVSGTRIVMIPQNTKLPVHKSFLYYASCQNAVVVHVVEGASFSKPNANASASPLHRLASIRVDGSQATKHLVLKIDITFEMASLDEMVVTAIERSSGRRISTRLTGDGTGMAATTIAHANARLENRIDTSTAMVLVPRHSVLQIPHLTGKSLLSTDDPIQLLEEFVQALEVAPLSSEDNALVRAIGSTLTASRAKRGVVNSAESSPDV